LLNSIEGFKKGGLKKVDKSEIRDNSAPILKVDKKPGGPGGPMGMPMMLPAKKGPAGAIELSHRMTAVFILTFSSIASSFACADGFAWHEEARTWQAGAAAN
jgi:hypothetical protein